MTSWRTPQHSKYLFQNVTIAYYLKTFCNPGRSVALAANVLSQHVADYQTSSILPTSDWIQNVPSKRMKSLHQRKQNRTKTLQFTTRKRGRVTWSWKPRFQLSCFLVSIGRIWLDSVQISYQDEHWKSLCHHCLL